MDWSFDLLTGPERALFRRTSVFVDGFDLEAAEGVCALNDIPDWDIADLLASLVDKSLVVAEPDNDDVRYRLQETLREYAFYRLAEAGASGGGSNEADQVAGAHAAYYMAFAEVAAPHLEGRSYRHWFRRLDAENLNLRAAFTHALATPGGTDRVLALFWSLRRHWRDARQPAQSLALIEQALAEVGSDDEPARRARALYCKAVLLGSLDRRLELAAISEALDLAREAGSQELEAEVLSRYSRSLSDNGSDQVAIETGAEAVALARQMGDPVLLGSVLLHYGSVLDQAGDASAEGVYLEALALVEHSGDNQSEWSLHNNYALVLIDQGHLADARHHLEAALMLLGEGLNSNDDFVQQPWLGTPPGGRSSAVCRIPVRCTSGGSTRRHDLDAPILCLGPSLQCDTTWRGGPCRRASRWGGFPAFREFRPMGDSRGEDQGTRHHNPEQAPWWRL